MASRRQRFYHFCLESVCLDIIFFLLFFIYAMPIPVQAKVHFKNLQFLLVTYDVGGGVVLLLTLSKRQYFSSV